MLAGNNQLQNHEPESAQDDKYHGEKRNRCLFDGERDLSDSALTTSVYM
jgi:hypothetical protein